MTVRDVATPPRYQLDVLPKTPGQQLIDVRSRMSGDNGFELGFPFAVPSSCQANSAFLPFSANGQIVFSTTLEPISALAPVKNT